MSRFGSTNYDANGGSTSSTEEYKDRDAMLLGRYAILSVNLDSVGVYDGNYGKNMILNMDDVSVVEGVVTTRTDDGDGNADGKIKVMGWDKWFGRDDEMNLVPFDEDGEVSTDELGRRITEEYGGTDYKYQVESGVLEDRDEPEDIGDAEIWLGNGKKARTLAKVLSARGHDVIDEDNKNDDREWLAAETDEEFELREELQGREIEFWFEETTLKAEEIDDLEDDITFTDSVVLDAESGAPITIPNDSDGSGSGGGSDASEGDSSTAEEDAQAESEEYPQELDELIDMFARTEKTEKASIEGMLRDEAPDDFDLDVDAAIDEIERRITP